METSIKLSENLKLNIKPICPIFIGSGYEIEPFELIPDPQNTAPQNPAQSNPQFFKIDLKKLIPHFSEQERNNFLSLTNKEKTLHILRKFIIETASKKIKEGINDFITYKLSATQDYANQFKEKLNSSEGMYNVLEFSRHPNGTPFIPGSSIKGSIRTAILNNLAKDPNLKIFLKNNISGIDKNKFKARENNATEVESSILKYYQIDEKNQKTIIKLDKDPFKTLKISDIELKDITLTLGNMKNISLQSAKNPLKKQGVPIKAEVLFIQNKSINAQISINQTPLQLNELNIKITKDLIIKACKNFYISILQKEIDKFRNLYYQNIIQQFGIIINDIKNKEDLFLLRLGRYSHFEAVTIHDFAEPKKTNSRTLFESQLPFGWAVCRFM